ncbi:ABC transporter ATP-binding protein [Streptomyces platensis subsp. malvinus]
MPPAGAVRRPMARPHDMGEPMPQQPATGPDGARPPARGPGPTGAGGLGPTGARGPGPTGARASGPVGPLASGAGPLPLPPAPGPGAPRAGERAAIETRGLTKAYRGGQLAVDGLDLVVPRGSVFGFLGPNGSGKTTTIRMLLGLIDATAGSARVLGEPMPAAGRRVLPKVGALIEGPALYGFLSGRENLRRFDAADPDADPRSRDERVGHALERVGLGAAAGKKARAYSLGMKQRLGLAAALLRPRELLVLDEPTNGLDPQGMREIRALVRELAADGTTVFLSSHLLDEIEQVCTHAAVMARGRLITQGTVADLSATVLGSRGPGRLTVTTPDPADAVRVLKEHGLTGLQITDDRVTGELPEADDGAGPTELADLNAALVHGGVRVRGFGTERATLEDVFVQLTGEGFDVAG